MVVLGLDPSLTHTAGCCAISPALVENAESAGDSGVLPAAGKTSEPRPFAIKSSPKDHAHPIARLLAIRAAFVAELERCESDHGHGDHGSDPAPYHLKPDEGLCSTPTLRLLAIEGYSFGSKNGREALGELGGMLRMVAFERGWTVLVVPPSTLKKYVTDSGAAPKERMLLGVFKRWGYSAPDNNAADAYALAMIGLDWCVFTGSLPAAGNLPKRVTALLGKLVAWGPVPTTSG